MPILTSVLQALIKNVDYKVYGWPIIILGIDPDGNPQAVNVDADGNLIVDVSVTPTGTQDVNLIKVGGTTFALGQQLAAASIPVVLPAGISRVPTCTAAVANGSTTGGVNRVTFLASSDFVGTVLGATFAAGASITFPAPAGDTIGAMGYTRSAGTLYIYYTP